MLKNYILQTVDVEGKVIEESQIFLPEGCTLIHTLPENITHESANHLHRHIAKQLEENAPLISVFHGSKFQVLNRQ